MSLHPKQAIAPPQASPQQLSSPQQTMTPSMQAPGQAHNMMPPQSDPRAELLAQLRDVHVPDAVGLWPPAPGWWLRAGISIFALVRTVKRFRSWHASNRYRAQTLYLLKQLQGHGDKYSDAQYTQAVLRLLKRCYLSAYPNAKNIIAPLYGESHLKFLLVTLKSKQKNQHLPDMAWAQASYLKDAKVDREALFDFAQHWIKHHRKLSLDALVHMIDASELKSKVNQGFDTSLLDKSIKSKSLLSPAAPELLTQGSPKAAGKEAQHV